VTETENSNEARNVAQTAKSARILRPAFLRMHNEQTWQSALRAVFVAPFLFLIKLYQWTLSPLLHALAGPNAGCRFYPSCSCYAADALRIHGVLRGMALAAWRLLRCNPFNAGGVDLVPSPRPPSRPHCQRVA